MSRDVDEIPLRAQDLDEHEAYRLAAQERLTSTKAAVDTAKAKIRKETLTGHFVSTTELQQVQHAIADSLTAAEGLFDRLSTCEDGTWKRHAADMESVWEDLSRLIRWLVRLMPE